MNILSARRCISLTLFLLLGIPFTVTADEPFKVTTTPDQLISLRANQASLKAIVEQIARELKIELQAKIGNNEKVTEEFNNLPLERALKLLSHNYITVTERKSGKIAKIFLLPQGQEAPTLITEVRPPATEVASEDDPSLEPQNDSTTVSRSDDQALETPPDNTPVEGEPGTEAPEDSPAPSDNPVTEEK